jgi:plasmid maintenance system killer protein
MDHVWNSLKQWEDIWLERIEDEKKRPEYDQKYINGLMKELDAIRRAMNEIHKCM